MKVLCSLALALLVFTGCKTADTALFTPTQWQTNFIAEHQVFVKTNVVTVTISVTNDVAGQPIIVTNTIREVLILTNTIPAHNELKPVAWEPNPATVGTVNAIGAAAGPWGALGAMAVTAILGGIAAFRGKKYKDAAISLAQGVQQVAEQFPEKAPAIFNTQKAVQDADGTRDTVRKVLKDVVKQAPVAQASQ